MSAARAARGGAAFVALSLLQRGLPFLVLPILATYLTPMEFGQIALLTALGGFLGALLSLGLEPWVVRTFTRLGSATERARFLDTVGTFSLLAPMAGCLLAVGLYILVRSALSELPAPGIAAIAFFGIGVQTTSLIFTGAVLRAQERISAYAVITLVQGVGGPASALILVVVGGLGTLGWFLAALLAGSVALLVGIALLGHRIRLDLDSRLLMPALVFGLPLLPHALAHWALSLSDRLILSSGRGLDEAGVYNVAYQLAVPIGLIMVALRQGSMPMYALATHDANLRLELGRLSTIHVHITGLLGLVGTLLGPVVLVHVFPESYRTGTAVLPWIALGYVFFGLYLIPADSLSLLLGKTKRIWVPSVAAASANVVLNLLFIPEFGMLAAAINTLLAYAILFLGVAVLRWIEEGPRIPYDAPRMLAGLFVAGVAGVVGLSTAPDYSSLNAAIVRVLIVAVACLVVAVFDRTWWVEANRRRRTVRS